ncbi:MAG: bifunctional DNA-binding transcriptional regulator/O6-methylguanine-DNA methyltransferase Ada [Burkholderiaceae bacterium]|nr:bifunctional DNA-binding transcriptional regulator/O6-methylguanine-DNA methyltransferase Ada [Burkholderiaceae bacterium]
MNRATQQQHAPSATAPQEDARWRAVSSRDARADGTFFYAVRTTGVYCRPTCPSRRARRENVSFFETCEQAEAAGYRPCRRCAPDAASQAERNAAMVREACCLIEAADEPPKLDALATAFGLSPFHFHRRFKAITGLTPKAWSAAHRARKVREALADPRASVTQAIYDAGFNSNSRFYEKSGEVMGMTPTAFRNGGRSARIRFAVGECSLGAVLVACSDRGVCAILLGDDPDALARELQDRFPNADLVGGDAGFEQLVAKVVGFVDAPRTGLDLPLDLRGTAFQQRVWQALRDIPAGQTVSYAEIARRIGAPHSVRAVGQACGANAIAVAIPCHRVVRHDGALAGYRWGVERKRTLLEKEASAE